MPLYRKQKPIRDCLENLAYLEKGTWNLKKKHIYFGQVQLANQYYIHFKHEIVDEKNLLKMYPSLMQIRNSYKSLPRLGSPVKLFSFESQSISSQIVFILDVFTCTATSLNLKFLFFGCNSSINISAASISSGRGAIFSSDIGNCENITSSGRQMFLFGLFKFFYALALAPSSRDGAKKPHSVQANEFKCES
ncbi:hypothetical protein NQ317_000126 [Molorchus minor]|uniref:Uncharacterized protein n=1 Tax=Molorchus minor TaxID=1323400 RepID=A0ABQ9JT67_9CUCU|nr:hypothetical protein NQ317_000126 [Molorchus minor]